MRIQLVDGTHRAHLLPLVFTRPVGALRTGILTIEEKYQKRGHSVGFDTETYLSTKFPPIEHPEVSIYGGVCPTHDFLDAVQALAADEVLVKDGEVLASKGPWSESATARQIPYEGTLTVIIRPWQLWKANAFELELDFDLLTAGRTSAPIDPTNTLLGDRIFLEPGAKATASILNSTYGAIYLAKDAEIMEGCTVRGGLALGEHAALKLGTKIYGATTLGPHCKVGGEVNNSILHAYSNKGHDGFLGNSYIGEWCNMGADSNNSNLKNNYDEVKIWSYAHQRFTKTGEQFCGLIMGDHSKCGINTMFNTGTVVGVSANIYGAGFPRNYIASFTWGAPQGTQEYILKKALDTAERMMNRRNIALDETERAILDHIYQETAAYRA